MMSLVKGLPVVGGGLDLDAFERAFSSGTGDDRLVGIQSAWEAMQLEIQIESLSLTISYSPQIEGTNRLMRG